MALHLSRRAWLSLAAAWVVSLVITAAVAAQVRPMDPLPEPVVLSGNDIGFRIEGTIDGIPAGRLVIRSRSGQWVEPQGVPGARRIPLAID